MIEEEKSGDGKSEEKNQPSSTDKSSDEKSGDTKSAQDRKPKEGPMTSPELPKLKSVAKSEERSLGLEKTQSFKENVSKEEDVRAKKSGKEEKKQPSSMDKSRDEKSGDIKSGEDRKNSKSREDRKSKESPMTSMELVPKLSKSGERMLSLEEKKQSEENLSKEGDVKRAKLGKEEKKQIHKKKPSSIWKMLILILINILNYLDRFTVAAVLTAIQAYYDINDAQVGLLWSAYMISSTLIAPVWGFLGDRYNRKYLIIIGLVLWTCTVFLSTFVPKDVGDYLFSFLKMYELAGIIRPTIANDQGL